MSRFLETSQFLKELNALWDQHAVHIGKANTALNKMLNTASKIPSVYIATLKAATAAQDALAKSSSRLSSETAKHAREITNLASRQNALLNGNKALQASIASLEQNLKRVNQQLADMKSKTAAAGEAQNRLKQKIKDTEAEVTRLTNRLNSSTVAVNRFSSSSSATFGKLTSLMSAFGIASGVYLFASIVKNIYTTTKELQSLDLALKMVSGTTEEFANNKAFISQVSEKWGLEIKSLTSTFTQFYTASKGLLSAADIKTTFEGIAKAGSIMGLSLEKQQAAFYAFDQMMSKGTVTAEELKKQLGNAMPGAIKAAAMAYMDLHPAIKTIQEAEAALYKDMKRGAIDSATYVPLIVKNFQKLYGIEMLDDVNTLQAAQNRFLNSWTDLVRSMNESETGGISIFFGVIANGVSNGLKLLTRYNTEWKKLHGDAREEGKLIGSDFYKTGGKSKNQLRSDYDVMFNEANSIASKINMLNKKFAKEGFFSEINPFSNTGEDIEKLNQELGQLEGAMQKIQSILNPLKPVTQKKKVDEETAAQKAARLKAAKEETKALEELLKNQYEMQLSNLEKEKFIIEQSMLSKTNNYSQNLRLAMDLATKEMEIATLIYDEEIRLAGKSNEKRIIADNKFYKEKVRLAEEYIRKVESIKFVPQYKDKNKVADEQTYGSGVFETNPETLKNMTDLWKEQQDEKDKIAAQEKARMMSMRDVLNDIFREFGQATGFEKTMDMFSKVGRNGNTFWENLTSKDGEVELKEGLLAGLTITQDIGNKIYEAKERRAEEDYARLEEARDTAIMFAGDSVAARDKIDDDYEKKRKEIARNQAKAKKQQAMFNIAMDTAQAIMGLWVKPGFPAAIPMAIAVGVLGAVQLAIAASRPIPSYYVGTDNAPEGFANTDEQGPELHLDKNNKIKDLGSSKGPRVKYLNKGDKILTASKTAELFGGYDISSLSEILSLNNISYNDNKNNQLDASGIIDSIHSLNQTILNKEASEEIYDVRGWTKFKKINGQRIEDKNNRIRFKKSI